MPSTPQKISPCRLANITMTCITFRCQGPEHSERGIYCVNHENITQAYLHPNGPSADDDGSRPVVDEVRKDINAHGVFVIEIQKGIDAKLDRRLWL
jgi:secreted PhoX family phosphatase